MTAQRVVVDSPATVSKDGLHPWYEMRVDPDNSANMMICGTKSDAQDDAEYGVVYYSADGGKSWTKALEDKNSTWVTEQSCAYGVHGIAYFVSDASKVIDGTLHHYLGTTRIYVSHDSGRTWTVGLRTGWTDFSTSVVDSTPGPNQNRLYVFFHNPWVFYDSIGQKEIANAELEEIKEGNAGQPVGMISYREGDVQVRGPITSAEMAREPIRSSFPAPALLLKDGSILTFYTSKRKTADSEFAFTLEAVRANADRSVLETPVKIVETSASSHRVNGKYCSYFLDSSGAYDPVNNTIYFAYFDIADNGCHLFITTSSDGGRSWSKGRRTVSPDEDSTGGYHEGLAMAVNQGGILGVMWEQKERSGCWMFAASTDGGESLSRATHLGTCSDGEFQPAALNSAYLMPSFSQAGTPALPSVFQTVVPVRSPNASIGIDLRNSRNDVERNENSIAVTPDGVFHPVWLDSGNGKGEIRTTAIHVTSASTLIADETKGLPEVTNDVAILYGGNQSYDQGSKTVSLDIVVKNISAKAIFAPFKLVVSSISNDQRYLEIANAGNGVADAGAEWEVSPSIPSGTLNPEATSNPYTLRFHYLLSEDEVPGSDIILSLKMKVFARKEVKDNWSP